MSRLLRFLLSVLLLLASALPAAASSGFSGFPNQPSRGLLDPAHAGPVQSSSVPLPGEPGLDAGTPKLVLGGGFPVYGIDVAVAGDVDGNGASDWLSGTPEYTPGGALINVGRVTITRRNQDGSVLGTKILDGSGDGALFGTSVASVGDVDGDGYDDIAIGAPGVNSGAGRVVIHRGSPAGTLNAPAWTIQGAPGDYLGYQVAYAGDVNGDGFDDVLVSAPGRTDGLNQQGAVYCYLGGGGGVAPLPVRTWYGTTAFEHLGQGIAGGGDVNADGYTDVLIGSPLYSNGQENEGRVRLFLGGPGGPSITSSWSYESDAPYDRVGQVVAFPGDMNGDGYGEIALGIPLANVNGTDDGRIVVFAGGPFLFALFPLYESAVGNSYMNYGFDVAPAGDVNGDGYADLITSIPFAGGFYNDGYWVIVYGSPILSTFDTSLYFPGPSGASAGLSVSGGGDRGNGMADVLVGYFVAAPPGLTTGDAGSAKAPAQLGETPGPGFLFANGFTFHEISYFPQRKFAQAGGETGFGVSTVMMDINGDGYDDAIVGGSSFSDGLSAQGVVRAYFGDEDGFGDAPFLFSRGGALDAPAGGPVQPSWNAPDWTYIGPHADANFALSMANAGDVNGDGYEDLLIGSPTASPDSSWEGAAYLFQGGPDGPDTQPSWVSYGRNSLLVHGYSVAGAGDVNQDGYADVLIGSPYASPGGIAQAGRADLYYGSSLGLVHVPARTWNGTVPGGSLGTSVSGAGDVDADGYPDVVIGEPGYSAGQPYEGRIRIFRGSASGVSASPFFEWESNVENADVGYRAARAGDVNGDGYADVMIGNPFWSNPEDQEGSVVILHGGAGTMTMADTLESNTDRAHFGQALSTAGDLDADGFSDLIIGAPDVQPLPPPPAPGVVSDQAPGRDQTATERLGRLLAPSGLPVFNEGAAFVYFGGSTGADPFQRYQFNANSTGLSGEVGRAVAGGGDLNGDGWPDLLYTAPYADALKSIDNGVISAAFSNIIIDGTGKPRRLLRADGSTPIAHGGRSDSPNSFRVAGIGRHPMGRGRARMQWQAKPPGANFDGTGVQTSASLRTGAPTSEFGSSAAFSGVASGLATGQQYRVRERYVTRNPYFPHTPWFTSARNGLLETDLRTFGPTGAVAVGDEVSTSPASLAFASPWPNPLAASGNATLSFALPAAGRVTIDAYNAQGRRVAHVHDADAPAGPSTVAWRGNDDAGRALPSGLYFLRLRSGDEERTVKAVLAR